MSSSTAQSVTSDRPIVGAYTPVTKSLWRERLRARGSTVPSKGLPNPVDKAPVFTSVSYDFSSDAELLEMVRCRPAHRCQPLRMPNAGYSCIANVRMARGDYRLYASIRTEVSRSAS